MGNLISIRPSVWNLETFNYRVSEILGTPFDLVVILADDTIFFVELH